MAEARCILDALYLPEIFPPRPRIYYIIHMNDIVPVLRPADSASPSSSGIQPLIAGRWSSRAIDETRSVDAEVINRIFEAGRWAPSAANNQPWRFLSFSSSDPEALEKARNALTSGNAWALPAPRLLFVLSRLDRPGSDKPNPRALYEAGMSAMAMALQAASEGLVFHQMAGFDEAALRAAFGVPDTFAIITAVAIGWPGDLASVPESKRSMETSERIRKSFDELVFPDGTVPAA